MSYAHSPAKKGKENAMKKRLKRKKNGVPQVKSTLYPKRIRINEAFFPCASNTIDHYEKKEGAEKRPKGEGRAFNPIR